MTNIFPCAVHPLFVAVLVVLCGHQRMLTVDLTATVILGTGWEHAIGVAVSVESFSNRSRSEVVHCHARPRRSRWLRFSVT